MFADDPWIPVSYMSTECKGLIQLIMKTSRPKLDQRRLVLGPDLLFGFPP